MQAISVSKSLEKQYESILITISRLDRNSQKDGVFIAKRDFDVVYEGIFLRSVTSFEAFIEELFIGMLYNKYEVPSRHQVQKVTFESRKLALNYILNGKRFLDLLPYSKLKDYLRVFYKERNPFTEINTADKKMLENLFIIRNSIAHSSVTSNRKFMKFIEDNHPTLPQRDRTPTKFLQSLHRPNQTILEFYLIQLNSLAHRISSYSG